MPAGLTVPFTLFISLMCVAKMGRFVCNDRFLIYGRNKGEINIAHQARPAFSVMADHCGI